MWLGLVRLYTVEVDLVRLIYSDGSFSAVCS